MKRLILFTIILSSMNAFAVKQDLFADERIDQEQTKIVKQRMEAENAKKKAPTSTTIGGARSGQFDFEKRQDMQEMENEHDLEKQRQLYEHEGLYRRGL